ncbi:MAG TPA: hypothetical protein VE777_03690 [Gaiellales bacterium]|jgi:hypothetical protein|nr:hypothetical protein [Gaiellales bacterium]
MTPIAGADRSDRRYHHEIDKHAKAAMNHRAALRRWIVKAADDGVDLARRQAKLCHEASRSP